MGFIRTVFSDKVNILLFCMLYTTILIALYILLFAFVFTSLLFLVSAVVCIGVSLLWVKALRLRLEILGLLRYKTSIVILDRKAYIAKCLKFEFIRLTVVTLFVLLFIISGILVTAYYVL